MSYAVVEAKGWNVRFTIRKRLSV